MLTVVGLSFRSAPVELREQMTIGERDLESALRDLGHGVVLSTCNRTEVYQAVDETGRIRGAAQFLYHRFAALETDFRPHLYELDGERAFRHLCSVTAGLDSMVLGEPQILGQVRAALDAAEANGTASPLLSHAFRQAIRVGRRARAETFVGRHAVTVSYAAVELARRVFGNLVGCRALVVGAGEMGELTVRTLVGHGVGVVAVANRTLANASALADRFGAEAIALASIVPALATSDIVITSTDSPDYVFDRADLIPAIAVRDGRPLFIIDIAVPRDVDPDVRGLDGVHLYDIDDLKALCELNREGRQGEIHRVRTIIDSEVTRFGDWWRTRGVVPTVVALRDQAERARQDELAEALAKLRHLSDADRDTVDRLTRAIVAKLLHRPTIALKEAARQADDEKIRSARQILGLDPEIPDRGVKA
ncbi:MAG: glutamyl-tRNA reductase [Chloroflexota bacterium]